MAVHDPIPDRLPVTGAEEAFYGGAGAPAGGVPPGWFRRSRRLAVGAAEPWVRLRLTPSRDDPHPAERARQLAAQLGGLPLALDVVAEPGRVTYEARTPASLAGLVRARLRVAFPRADMTETPPEPDPALPDPAAGEEALARRLAVAPGPAWPLARLERLAREEAVPPPPPAALAGILEPGERVVARLLLAPAPDRVGQALAAAVRRRQEAQERARQGRQHYPWQSAAADLQVRAVTAGTLLAAGLGYALYAQGRLLDLALLGGTAVSGIAAAILVPRLLAGGGANVPAPAAAEKLAGGGPLLAARLELVAAGPRGTAPERLAFLLEEAAALYGAAGGALGAGLAAKGPPGPPSPPPAGPGVQGAPGAYLVPGELALLWHPHAADPHVTDAGARYPLPDPEAVAAGCYLGTASYQGQEIPVHQPASMLRDHQLVVAKTGMGKSTLLFHQAVYLLERMAQGREDLSLLVLDPHGDLAADVAAAVPPAVRDRAVYLDLARPDRVVGLNLLDRALFPRGDLMVEHAVSMLRQLWPDNWGPRMEIMLRVALAALHEANGALPRDRQYTLLDVSAFLTNDEFREQVFRHVHDPALLVAWQANYTTQDRRTQLASVHPVTTKVGRFMVTETARLIFGQPVSTFDPAAIIGRGQALIIDTSSMELGEGGAELLGATLLNLLAQAVEAQAALPPERRRRIAALVDESATLGAADYQRMLGELRKYGLALVLVTQSLTRLGELSPALADHVFANVAGVTAFACSAKDAEYLTKELGWAVDPADLVGLPGHECYARWQYRGRPVPPFRFRLAEPGPRDREAAADLARASMARYGRPREEVRREVNRLLAAHGGAGVIATLPPLGGAREERAWEEA